MAFLSDMRIPTDVGGALNVLYVGIFLISYPVLTVYRDTPKYKSLLRNLQII